MPRPTVRGYALLGLALATYLAGRVVGTWELYLFAFAFFAAVALSWLSVVATGKRIKVTRGLTPERPVAGDEPELAFTFKNESLLPGPELGLQSALAGMTPADVELEVGSLDPREERGVKTHIGRVNRGVHSLPAAQLLAEDLLGLARVVRKVATPLVVTVYPRIALLDSCALYPDLALKHDWSGHRGSPAFGATELRGVRPHQPGEPLSRIDWKSTAKTGVLMLREMEEPAGADVTLLLDGTARELEGEPPDNNFELAVRAAGSIADFVLRANRGVTLLCHEREWRRLRLTPDGGGRRALLQALAEARPNAQSPLVSALRHLRTDGPHLLRVQGVTVVSMSLSHQLVRALVSLHEDAVKLSFVYVAGGTFGTEQADAVSTLLPFLPPKYSGGDRSDVRPRYLETLSTEARASLLALSSAGIPCLTISPADDLAGSLSLWHTGRQAHGSAR